MNPSDIINSILAVLSFILALISIITVIITIKQNEKLLQANKRQLEEMQEEHRLSAQPIITLVNGQFFIERPRFFYTPPEDTYSFLSRYRYRAFLKNVTSSTAICIDASAKLILPEGKMETQDIAKRQNVLTNNTKSRPVSFLFVEDKNFDLYQVLRENKVTQLPRIEINIVYKNTCGGCFLSKQTFLLAPKDEDLNTIRSWHTVMASASVESKEMIDEMKRIRSEEKWEQRFQAAKETFDSRLGSPDKSGLCLDVIEVPEKYDFRILSQSEYDKIVKNYHYPHFVRSTTRCPIVEEKP